MVGLNALIAQGIAKAAAEIASIQRLQQFGQNVAAKMAAPKG